jgi:hypothetical protein
MPHAAGGSGVWRKSHTALTRRTPRSVLIMTGAGVEPMRLDGLAMAIWDELERPASDEHLVDRVASRVGAEAPAIRGDVLATRAALGHIGAITEAR